MRSKVTNQKMNLVERGRTDLRSENARYEEGRSARKEEIKHRLERTISL